MSVQARGPVGKCTGEIRIAGVSYRCQREPHYANGQHAASVCAMGIRAADHPSPTQALRDADLTLKWTIE